MNWSNTNKKLEIILENVMIVYPTADKQKFRQIEIPYEAKNCQTIKKI